MRLFIRPFQLVGFLHLVTAVGVSGGFLPGPGNILSNPNAVPDQEYGARVAVDGLVAAVGAPAEPLNPSDPASPAVGAVHLYTRAATGWQYTTTVRPEVSAATEGMQFGTSVALRGNQLLVGAPQASSGDLTAVGAVHVFARDAGGWIQTGRLLPVDPEEFKHFGASLAVDGDRLIVGAPNDGESFAGAVYFYQWLNGQWSFDQKLPHPEPDFFTAFGYAVDIRGGTVVVGAPNQSDGPIAAAGAAYTLRWTDAGWTPVERLSFPGLDFWAGAGTAVAADGDRILVGAPFQPRAAGPLGIVQVFTRSTGVWTTQPTEVLEAPAGAEASLFGAALDLVGSTAVVGAPGDSPTPEGASMPWSNTGTAYLFNLTEPGPGVELTPAERTSGESFGNAVALDLHSLLIGAPNWTEGGCMGSCTGSGAAHLFESNQSPVAVATGPAGDVTAANGIDAQVTLSATGSTDPDGDPLTFRWLQGATVLGTNPALDLTLPVGESTFAVEVSDGRAVASATVSVRVVAPPINQPPVADPSRTPTTVVATPESRVTVQLDGSASTDPEGSPLRYRWTQGDTLLGEAVQVTVSLPLGSHTILLTVSDGQLEDSEALTVTVTAPDDQPNHPPIADASRTALRVISPNNCAAEVRLDASKSSDPDGDQLTFAWYVGKQLRAKSAVATVSLPPGTHAVRLIVSDGSATSEAQLAIRVVSPAQAVRTLTLKVEAPALPKAKRNAALALLKNAERAFARGRMALGVVELQLFEAVLRAGKFQSGDAAALIDESRTIRQAVCRR